MNRRHSAVWLGMLVAALAAGPVPASSAPPPATPPVGLVIMHGKQSMPAQFAGLTARLERLGYLVTTPEMCWSGAREYDRTYPDCLREIDAAIDAVRGRGAQSIVLIGHSLGGAAAIDYAATHDGISGVVGLAAADNWFPQMPADIGDAIDRARALVAQHHGDTVETFVDRGAGHVLGMRTSAEHYLSFLAPETQVMRARAAQLRAPLLMVAGAQDPYTRDYQQLAFRRVPQYALNRFVTVGSDHFHVPIVGESAMLAWLRELAASP